MRNIYILVLLVLIGLSPKAQLTEELKADYQSYLQNIVDVQGAKGLNVAVKVGETSYQSAHGFAATDVAMSTDDLMAMGSITKTFVSAIILSMVEDGLLSLDDPLSMYIKDFQFVDNSVTIKQCLNHTSGIYNYTNHPFFFFTIASNLEKTYTLDDVMSQFVLPKAFSKGEKQEYSNTNYLLLGAVIESITSNSFITEFQNRFNSQNNYPSVMLPPYDIALEEIAHLWFDTSLTGTQPIVDFVDNGFSLNAIFTAANSAGALVATPMDIANWAHDLYTGQLLSEASMQDLFDYDPHKLFGIYSYGLGVQEADISCGVTGVGHGGNIIYTSSLLYVEEYDMTVVVMTNDGTGLPNVGGVESISDELICMYKLVLDVDENEVYNSITISPNPSFDVIKLEGLDNVANSFAQIYSASGELVFSENDLINNTINISTLADGLYYLKMNNGKSSITKSFVKMSN